jgi:uncharacterized protein (DUF1800 family)
MRSKLLSVAVAALFFPAAHAAEPTATVVEFYNTNLKHYFITAEPSEASGIDAGAAGAGWVRTGGRFSAWKNAGDADGLNPVCRFYGTPGKGPNSHFYTADAAECAKVKTDPGWLYEGIVFHIATPQGGNCPDGTTQVLRSYNNGFARNDSNHRYTVDYTVFAKATREGYSPEGTAMCAPKAGWEVEADAVRLLRQSTFGPTDALVERVKSIGAEAWLNEQFAMPATPYPAYPYVSANRPDTCVDDRTQPVHADSYCARDNYSLFQLQRQFFADAIAAPDQLRQRVAFAYSQIFVTSGVENSRNYAMRNYQQIFRDKAFANYEDIITAVTLSPMMGDYLNMVNNDKPDPVAGTQPNENYARELLQLFSIGLYNLNPDGSVQYDAQGKPVPTYSQDQVEGFAHVFTGWTYPTITGLAPRTHNPRNYLGQMEAVASQHDTGSKLLLGGTSNPGGLPMQQDLALALHNVFLHPNVGPFIGRQLIQKLVTSDPTPGYVSRVAAVFDNNGYGVRGDMRAVVRAVLLDAEARGANKIDPAWGKLAEPVLWMMQASRAFDAKSDGVFYRAVSAGLGQFLFYPPTVFNYFPPDYPVPGTQTLGPEFGIQTATTALNRVNVANALVFSNGIAPDASVYGSTGTSLDLTSLQALANDANALVDRLDRLLLAGAMSTSAKAAIVAAVNAVPASDPVGRARTAAYLVLSSSQYAVER